MSDYTKTTNFTAKDALSTGDPNKVIKGEEHDTEFDNISTAVATKANKISGGSANNVVEQSAGGDLVDTGLATPTGAFVGTTDTQTLTNKTITQLKLEKGADVASAGALTLGSDGNYFDITGTTAITSIGTIGVGTVVRLHFDAALTLTHHATDLILPSGANITTAAGDEAEFVEYATGDWRCTSYTPADGLPVATISESALDASVGAWIELSQKTASGDPTLDFDNLISSTYDRYKLVIEDAMPATDAANLYLRVGTGAGPTYQSTLYSHNTDERSVSSGTITNTNSNSTSQLDLSAAVGLDTGSAQYALSGEIDFFNPNSTVAEKRIKAVTFFGDNTGSHVSRSVDVWGNWESITALTSVQFLMSSGNIEQGVFTLYGLKT